MLQDEATRQKAASVGEVAEVSRRTGAKRAECGGVLPGEGVVRTALFRMEKTIARGGWRAHGAAHAPWGVCGSPRSSGGVGAGGRYAGAESGQGVASGRRCAGGSFAQEWAGPVGGAGLRRRTGAGAGGGVGERGMRGLPSLR